MAQTTTRGTRSSKPPRGHHVVPAYLLGKFATPETLELRPARDRRLYVYMKGSPPTERSVGTECKESNYFSRKNADGSVDVAIESLLNEKYEIPFNDVLDCITSQCYPPSERDRYIVTRYVANLFMRCRPRRDARTITHDEVADCCRRLAGNMSAVRLIAAAASISARRAVPVSLIVERLRSNPTESTDEAQDYFSQHVVQLTENLAAMLRDRTYGLLGAPDGKEFLLGDNPVMTRRKVGAAFSVGYGFDQPDVHVIMPICPQYCIQIGIEGGFSRTILPAEVDDINRDSIRLAYKKVYGSRLSEGVQTDVEESLGSIKYRQDAFVLPPLQEEKMLEQFVTEFLHLDGLECDHPAVRAWRQIATLQ